MKGNLAQQFLTNKIILFFTYIIYVVNFPHMDSNIPTKPAYGVYISQLVRIGCIYDSYESFFTRHHLTCRLVKQGFLYDKVLKDFVEDGICLPTVCSNYQTDKKK